MQKIIEGYEQFRKSGFKAKKDLFEKLSNTQSPQILFITCSDSRIDPNFITQTEPGDLFVIRNAGNIVPPYSKESDGVVASVEFAVNALGVKHIVVCGHSNCGAMKGAIDSSNLKGLPRVESWLKYAAEAVQIAESKTGILEANPLKKVTFENILLQLRRLQQYPEIAKRLSLNEIKLHGWMYDIGLGTIHNFNHEKQRFIAI
ncbi:MAG: hypothetical protein CBC42_04580 [Betaproteobacteria bacterium TMED82]|nr:MAG: hypothetical protein CBC42_04580 [Betaproteobacteria bacterium TMED82]|tara:strand:- start:5844 stop:6452 length:609 start_codon:yes stop_codon:yes gene_type:complete